jgi:two-component system phosphate regulon response regulator PhoB
MALILVVEDEGDIRQILSYNLGQAGHQVLTAERGSAALELARKERPALVLLDLMLPDISGLDVCRLLKSDPTLKHIPVIMLTARSEEIDRVVGFELGADDYVVKPFSVRELVLRIQAVLRRAQTNGAADPADAASELLFGRLRVDRSAHRTWVDGEEVLLTPLEMRLLWTLYLRRGRVQTRATLLDEVWEASPENNTRTVDTHIKRLREKLGAAGVYVETVRGIGYRFASTPETSGGSSDE